MRTATLGRTAMGLAVLALLLAVAPSAQAQALFSDDFGDGNANGWTSTSGSWSVVTDGTPVYRVAANGGNVRSNAGNTAWTNYSVQARIKPLSSRSSSWARLGRPVSVSVIPSFIRARQV